MVAFSFLLKIWGAGWITCLTDDQFSTNGTFVNGAKVGQGNSMLLPNGAEVTLVLKRENTNPIRFCCQGTKFHCHSYVFQASEGATKKDPPEPVLRFHALKLMCWREGLVKNMISGKHWEGSFWFWHASLALKWEFCSSETCCAQTIWKEVCH
jgi:hypothetical protein